MSETIVCEYCAAEFPKKTYVSRFCGKSCSAKWRMRQPQHRAKVYTTERNAKLSANLVKFFTTPSEARDRRVEITRNINLGRTLSDLTRARVSKSLRTIRHQPERRGGNGKGMSIPQCILWSQLGRGWIPEHVVPTKWSPSRPFHYKIDLACPSKKIAVEIDGYTHSAVRIRISDRRKEDRLKELGWKVYRYTNQEVLNSWERVGEEIRSYCMT